ncbi:MAG TPA: hypothetical protein VK013_11690 [Myxococcaceae bacterium]|nr:hypothetical protein [Myxococcaceae bacterium]
MSFKRLQGLWADDEPEMLEALSTPQTDPALLVAVGVVAGLGVGLALGMLLAPRSGAETRHALGTKLSGHRETEPDEVDSVLGVG